MYFSRINNFKKVIQKCIILMLALVFVLINLTSSVYAGSFYDSTQKEFAGRGINVKWYGAKGNGKNDDTLAIRKAISKLRDGDTLLFPAGKYYVSRNGNNPETIDGIASYVLAIKNIKNLTIMGFGAELIQPDYNVDAVTLGIYQCDDIKIFGLTFDGQQKYTASTPIIHKQQLLHVIQSYNPLIEYSHFKNAFGNALAITHQYKNRANTIAYKDQVRVLFNTFEHVNQTSTIGAAVSELIIMGNMYRNVALGAFKFSSDPDVTKPGYETAFKNIILEDNIITYDNDYSNPLREDKSGPNTYFVGIDCVSNANNVLISGNIIDFNNKGPAALGIKINWSERPGSSDEGLAVNTVRITNNTILNAVNGSSAVNISNTVYDVFVEGNTFKKTYRGVTVTPIGNTIESWDRKSILSITNNKFIDLASVDILLNKLSILRLTINGNESILKDISSSLQFLASDTTSNIDELIIINNNVNKTIGYSGESRKVALTNNSVSAQANTSAVGINLNSKQTGSLITAAGNTVTAGARFYLRNASRMMVLGNVINNLTDSTAALQCLNSDFVKVENNDLYNNVVDYSFKGSTIVTGSFTGQGVPTIPVSSGSTWTRTDGEANTTFYIREGTTWVAK